MAVHTASPPDLADLSSGAYLTDGTDLYRVVDSFEGYVKVEDCRTLAAEWIPVEKMLRGDRVRRVKPARSAELS